MNVAVISPLADFGPGLRRSRRDRRFPEFSAIEPRVRACIRHRLAEFREIRLAGRTIFDFKPFLDFELKSDAIHELFFCLLTANYSAKRACIIQKNIGYSEWLSATRMQLLYRLLGLGYRFPAVRSRFIVQARENLGMLYEMLSSDETDFAKRDRLVRGFYGLGYKTASQLLRNTGHFGVAIIDRQVMKFLVQRGLVEPVKTITERRYKKIESLLLKIADSNSMSVGELDLYIFYLQTGQVLK